MRPSETSSYAPPEPFETMDQVREYVSGDRIQCLVCGRFFKRLQFMHLLRHNMNADDYRAAFGIPWSTSLTSAVSREASSCKMTPERIEAFKKIKTPRGGWNTHIRPNVPAVRNMWKQNAKLGRYLAHEIVTAACATCGTPIETTALTAIQPIHCDKCATPGSLKSRAYQRRKKLREQTAVK